MNRRTFVAGISRGCLALPVLAGVGMLGGNGCAGRPGANLRVIGIVDDAEGSLGRTEGPVAVDVRLEDRLCRAGDEGRLVAFEQPATGGGCGPALPVQLMGFPGVGVARVAWRIPPGAAGERRFLLGGVGRAPAARMSIRIDAASGQHQIMEAGKSVLRYNHSTVEPGKVLDAVSADNKKYAVARSDYIHPLWGPNGEELTRDWSPDHPHHRGIYWAWPEVDWRGKRGDLHALQMVFSRPWGRCRTLGGPLFAEIDAENTWVWESGEEIVYERAIIRAWNQTLHGRLLDLEFHFSAIGERVLLARRGTDKYGGLSLRFAGVQGQQIYKHDPKADGNPGQSWADLSGTFPGATSGAGVTILQKSSNPYHPGDWIEYPELNWLQPTFPAAETRYALEPGRPLLLRYRLWIHAGWTPSERDGGDHWRSANSLFCPAARA